MPKLKTKQKTKTRRRVRRGYFRFRDLIAANSYAALRDESYTLIQRHVEEMLRDPELRETIDYHAREILKAIAAKL